MPTYTDYDSARRAFDAMMQDVQADFGEEALDDAAPDLVVSTAMDCDAETARELCRTELGYVPDQVLQHFPGMRPMEVF